MELKNIIIELKNLVKGFNIRLDQVEEMIGELQDKAVEFIQSEEQKETKIEIEWKLLKEL